ncbi:MAG TPA: GNAT family N-acetyltransferase [Ignavibacteriaceae bacterium]
MTGNDILISTDKALLNTEVIYNFLNSSYWAQGRTLQVIKKSIRNSLCFGVFLDGQQIGFARVISDYATFAYLADVFILEEYRGNGFSKKLLKYILSHPDLQNMKRWMLATRDAHNLYRKFGFTQLKNPERFMEIVADTLKMPDRTNMA